MRTIQWWQFRVVMAKTYCNWSNLVQNRVASYYPKQLNCSALRCQCSKELKEKSAQVHDQLIEFWRPHLQTWKSNMLFSKKGQKDSKTTFLCFNAPSVFPTHRIRDNLFLHEIFLFSCFLSLTFYLVISWNIVSF